MIAILKKYKYCCNVKNRNNLMMLTQILSGTNILNYSRSVRKKERDPFCSACRNIRETSEHFLTACPKLANARQQCFNKNYSSIKEIIMNNKMSNIIEFIRDSRRFTKKQVA